MPNNKKDQSNRVKLIFNVSSGANGESPLQLINVIKELQALDFVTDVYLIEPDCDLNIIVQDAIFQGINLFVVCGGDGTVSAVTKAMIGTDATLAIIPTGTQNNVALSLNIPTDIPAAIAILRTGQRVKVDMGIATCENKSIPFIEICSVGLFSTLLPSGDEIQHGNITRIGDFLTTLTSSPPSEIHLLLEDKQEIQKLGHVVLVSNMPYVGQHYLVGADDAFNDGLLDVIFFADLSKIDLVGYVIKGPGTSTQEDPRIQHYRVRKVVIKTHPDMPIMADGIAIGNGMVEIEVRRHALAVMVGQISTNKLTVSGEIIAK